MGTKRATMRTKRLELRRAERAEGIKPKGKSRYAQKLARQIRGSYKPPAVNQRPSWFVRCGWAERADHNLKASPAEMVERRGRAA
jgi:hypothetical protein